MGFKPKEFMQVMIEIRDELRAVRKLLEEQSGFRYTYTINNPWPEPEVNIAGGIYTDNLVEFDEP